MFHPSLVRESSAVQRYSLGFIGLWTVWIADHVIGLSVMVAIVVVIGRRRPQSAPWQSLIILVKDLTRINIPKILGITFFP